MVVPNRSARRLLTSSFVFLSVFFATAAPSSARLPIEDPGQDAAAGIYCTRPPYVFTHDVGKMTLQVTNLGFFGNPYIEALSLGYMGGEYLYIAGLWVGAMDEDSIPHVSTAAYDTEFRPLLDDRDVIYRSYEGIPGGKRYGPVGSLGDDDGDGVTDEDFQDGYDNDGDGRIDEDFEAIGQQMFSCTYRDDSQQAMDRYNEHVPWGLSVQQRSFGWAVSGSDEFIGVDYRIRNDGTRPMLDVYVGLFVDPDAGPKAAPGYWEDDLVGYTDTFVDVEDPLQATGCQSYSVPVQMVYVWDAKDDGVTAKGGDVSGYSGVMYLGCEAFDRGVRVPLDNVGVTTVKWFSSNAPYPEGDPETDPERYDLMSSGFIADGKATIPRDYRYVFCVGPFRRIEPGQEIPFQIAFVSGDSYDGLIRSATAAELVYRGRYFDARQDKDHLHWGFDGKETLVTCPGTGCYKRVDDDCDTTTARIILKEGMEIGSDEDCDKCTGMGGRESLVHWVGSTSPPPADWNNDPGLAPAVKSGLTSPAGDGRVTLEWDNGSEVVPDPLTGQFRFEGYRVWKSTDWKRPIGETGPPTDRWMMLGDFSLHPPDSLGTQSSKYLLNTRQWGGDTTFVVYDTSLTPIDTLEYGIPIAGTSPPQYDSVTVYRYPIGRYRLVDFKVVNGMLYFYSITPYSKWYDATAGAWVEIQSQPAATEDIAVIPRADARARLGKVTVVPNPYLGGAQWDLNPSDRDPTGTKIGFYGLPRARSTLRIFTLAGDLVKEIEHDGTGGDGTAWWNLITRNGQDAVSGVYLFSVDCAEGTYVGKFVIVR